MIKKNEEQDDMGSMQKTLTSRARTLDFRGVKANKGSEDFYIQLDSKNLTIGLEKKVCNYVRLYTSFINAGRKFLLAHNKFVSTFNLVKDKWVKHKKYTEGYVR